MNKSEGNKRSQYNTESMSLRTKLELAGLMVFTFIMAACGGGSETQASEPVVPESDVQMENFDLSCWDEVGTYNCEVLDVEGKDITPWQDTSIVFYDENGEAITTWHYLTGAGLLAPKLEDVNVTDVDAMVAGYGECEAVGVSQAGDGTVNATIACTVQ